VAALTGASWQTVANGKAGGLREYATQHGADISGLPSEADTTPEATLTTPDTPETHLIMKHCHNPENFTSYEKSTS
jgi:hypothetical protein